MFIELAHCRCDKTVMPLDYEWNNEAMVAACHIRKNKHVVATATNLDTYLY